MTAKLRKFGPLLLVALFCLVLAAVKLRGAMKTSVPRLKPELALEVSRLQKQALIVAMQMHEVGGR